MFSGLEAAAYFYLNNPLTGAIDVAPGGYNVPSLAGVFTGDLDEVLGFGIDYDRATGGLALFKNGVKYTEAKLAPSGNVNPMVLAFSGMNDGGFPFDYSFNFGAAPFAYQVPAGYMAGLTA
jgi:hypothetical protein